MKIKIDRVSNNVQMKLIGLEKNNRANFYLKNYFFYLKKMINRVSDQINQISKQTNRVNFFILKKSI